MYDCFVDSQFIALILIPQVIDGKDIPGGGFHTFGYSISGGVDVDRNSYPDIAVGSLDDRVVLLRLFERVTIFYCFSYFSSIASRYKTN